MMVNLPFRCHFPWKESSGQALLVILLIMAVALTISLAVISRSITDIRISQQTEEAARAYSAAEAGIEEALITGVSNLNPPPFETGATYKTAVAGFGEGTEFVFPQPVTRDDIQTLWLANNETLVKVYDRDQLKIYWGNPGVTGDQTPALEVLIYYQDGTNYKVGRIVLDPYTSRSPDPSFCNPGEQMGVAQCTNVDSFSTAVESMGDKNFQFNSQLDISNFRGGAKILLFARLRLLYSTDSHVLGAKAWGSGTSAFPSQGQKIESTGQAGEATRRVEVLRFYPAPSEIFDFVLYSEGGLTK